MTTGTISTSNVIHVLYGHRYIYHSLQNVHVYLYKFGYSTPWEYICTYVHTYVLVRTVHMYIHTYVLVRTYICMQHNMIHCITTPASSLNTLVGEGLFVHISLCRA